MATASIGGLASGLDTASIISQLMQLEAQPQTKLKTQVTTEQGKLSALQQVNNALATLGSTAGSLLPALSSSASTTWTAIKATSSADAVAASATSAAQPGTLTVEVDAVATAASTSISGVTPSANTTFALTDGSGAAVLDSTGAPVVFTTDATPTLAELATAINASSATSRLSATVVHGTAGDVLQIRSTASGVASNFSISDGTQTFSAANGTDGQIRVNGVVITGSSNTYAGVADGVDITVSASATAGTTSTITLARDASARSASVKSLVDGINSVLDLIAAKSATNADATKAGALAGDATVRSAADKVRNALYPSGSESMAPYGIELDRYGKLTFDADRFAAAFAADPDAVSAAIAGPSGLASRVKSVAEAASDKYDGYVTSAITGRNATIKRLNDSIAAWDDRLALRRTTLERQYTALETAMSSMQAQSAWLTSQLASLTASTSTS